MADNTSSLFKLTVSIVSAYVRHNSLPSAELPALIGQVHTALTLVLSGHGEVLGNRVQARDSGEEINRFGLHHLP